MPNEPITTYSALGSSITLYQNRLEHKQSACTIVSKRETIFYKNITSIERPPMLACIDVHTSDGKVHRIPINPISKADEIKAQLDNIL